MGYSLRTRSASTASVTTEPATKKAAPAKKSAAPTKKTVAPAKKPAASKKPAAPKKAEKTVAEPKKTVPAKKAAPKAQKVVKTEETEVKTAAKVAAKAKSTAKTPAKAPTKAAVKKTTAAKPVKATTARASKASTTKAVATKPVKKAAARKAPASPKKKATISAPVVTIEEVDTPSLPEVEPIYHEEPEIETEAEKVVEIVEGEVVNTHIRFSDDENEEVESVKLEEKCAVEDVIDSKASPSLKEVSIHSSDFEALDELKDDSPAFELYQSESDDEGVEAKEEDITLDEFDEEEKINEGKESPLKPLSNSHSAFEAFTSQEDTKTFNWSHTGSTYYQGENKDDNIKSDSMSSISEPENKSTKPTDEPVTESTKTVAVSEPTVISNPFGFGFTATATPSSNSTYPISHFQSISSPLDKLCNLTTSSQVNNANNNPIKVASTFGTSGSDIMASSNMPSSYLPTSPAMPSTMMLKASKSPSIQGDKEAPQRSPSAIQSIIVDDKHEDFSAF